MHSFCLFLLFAVSVLGAVSGAESSYDCSNVNCTRYNYDVQPHTGEFQECRFELRNDFPENKFKSGLQIHTYATAPNSDYEYDQTQDCPAQGKLRMTESPKVTDLSQMFSDVEYRNCCAEKVVRICYYKVLLYMKCHGWSDKADDTTINNDRLDDEVDYVEVIYKNKEKGKQVTVKFYPEKGLLNCSNNFNSSQTAEVNKTTSATMYCGDSDINVEIRSYLGNGTANGSRVLKVHRWECNSQYAAMFTDPSEREKFTMRTVVDPDSDVANYYVGSGNGRTKIAPVLAKTRSGACGTIAADVYDG